MHPNSLAITRIVNFLFYLLSLLSRTFPGISFLSNFCMREFIVFFHVCYHVFTKSSKPRMVKAENPDLATHSVWARERCCSIRTPSSCFTKICAASNSLLTRIECTGDITGRQEMPKTNLTMVLVFLVRRTWRPLTDRTPSCLTICG